MKKQNALLSILLLLATLIGSAAHSSTSCRETLGITLNSTGGFPIFPIVPTPPPSPTLESKIKAVVDELADFSTQSDQAVFDFLFEKGRIDTTLSPDELVQFVRNVKFKIRTELLVALKGLLDLRGDKVQLITTPDEWLTYITGQFFENPTQLDPAVQTELFHFTRQEKNPSFFPILVWTPSLEGSELNKFAHKALMKSARDQLVYSPGTFTDSNVNAMYSFLYLKKAGHLGYIIPSHRAVKVGEPLSGELHELDHLLLTHKARSGIISPFALGVGRGTQAPTDFMGMSKVFGNLCSPGLACYYNFLSSQEIFTYSRDIIRTLDRASKNNFKDINQVLAEIADRANALNAVLYSIQKTVLVTRTAFQNINLEKPFVNISVSPIGELFSLQSSLIPKTGSGKWVVELSIVRPELPQRVSSNANANLLRADIFVTDMANKITLSFPTWVALDSYELDAIAAGKPLANEVMEKALAKVTSFLELMGNPFENLSKLNRRIIAPHAGELDKSFDPDLNPKLHADLEAFADEMDAEITRLERLFMDSTDPRAKSLLPPLFDKSKAEKLL